jgi:hypothetical protein
MKRATHRAIARSNRGGSAFASNRQNASPSGSESSPISRAAISAFRRLRFLIARVKRPCAEPWLVIVKYRWGYGWRQATSATD